MEERRHSPTSDAPEAVPNQHRSTFGFVGSDDYEYFEPPPSAFERQRSPVPEYQQYETSPRISAQSPPPPSSDIGRSPQISEGGFIKSRPLSPSVQYSEIHSPDPERVYNEGEKEAVHSPPTHHSKVPSYYAGPAPGIYHQNSGDKPQLWSADQQHQHQQHQEQPKKTPFYKRWWFWLVIVALIVIIAVAVACGVVFGTNKSNKGADSSTGAGNSTSSGNGTSGTNTNADPNTSVGGYLNDAYYSTSGAFNGSGIAIAAANTEENQSLYAFYQDPTGMLQYTVMDSTGQWNLVGPVNSGSYKALNGTPLSTVQHIIGAQTASAQAVWHLFYIDEDYIVRERIITNTTTNSISPVWADGPLSKNNLRTWQSNTIGLQACYWGNFYGQWSYDESIASMGIHIWFASDATTFQQYSWTNGTDTWNFDQQWPDLSGNGGVGCQTWYSMTEYVWFVNTKNELAMFWKDNNRSTTDTTDHPVGKWTPVDIKVENVQIDSGLGYTVYMIWQDQDTTIKGANVTWLAENTTIVAGDDGRLDEFTLQYQGKDVNALRGTHLSITGITTPSDGHELLVFFQEAGDDMMVYTRDVESQGGLWQQASDFPVEPDTPDS